MVICCVKAFPRDMERIASLLGFDGVRGNTMDAVSSRDFITDVFPCLAITGTYVSMVASELIRGSCTGVQEILKRGVIGRIVSDSRVSYETGLVEKLLEEIAKDSGLAAYGLNEVKKAMEHEAGERLQRIGGIAAILRFPVE